MKIHLYVVVVVVDDDDDDDDDDATTCSTVNNLIFIKIKRIPLTVSIIFAVINFNSL